MTGWSSTHELEQSLPVKVQYSLSASVRNVGVWIPNKSFYTMNPNFLKQCAAILCAAFTLTTASLFAETFTEGKQVPPTTQKLAVGDFVWEPERSPGGPILIVVSVPEQVAYVYRNGIRIARTSVSTGRPGHPTPTGVFDILEKEKDHVSTIYKGAEMPWMERLTWTGIAMHAGDLPGYPDSHGCVRLPLEFSKLLYTVTTKGGTVIIADQHSAPRETVHPGRALLAGHAAGDRRRAGAGSIHLDTGEIRQRTRDDPCLGTGQSGLRLSKWRRNRTLDDPKCRDQRLAHL